MRQVKRIKFGSGIQKIDIYRIGDRKDELIDVEYTNVNGILRWMPPSMGVYNLICESYPEYSITGMIVNNDAGYADNFNYQTT